MKKRLRAVIFVRDDEERSRWEAACLEYCDRCGYEVVSLVVGDWSAVHQMFAANEADIVVVASKDQLAPDRTPRIESVTEELPKVEDGPRHRRTGRVQRWRR